MKIYEVVLTSGTKIIFAANDKNEVLTSFPKPYSIEVIGTTKKDWYKYPVVIAVQEN